MLDTDAVSVQLNGKDREIPSGITVAGLLEFLNLNPSLVVVELNREILDRARYDEARVVDGDQVELVHFVGGG
jgi:sulfur carrier protein